MTQSLSKSEFEARVSFSLVEHQVRSPSSYNKGILQVFFKTIFRLNQESLHQKTKLLSAFLPSLW